jgi:N-acetylglucosamine-6-sulfatase
MGNLVWHDTCLVKDRSILAPLRNDPVHRQFLSLISIGLNIVLSLAVSADACAAQSSLAPNLELAKLKDAKPRSVIYILVDDLRYDAFGFMGHPFLKTPHIDAMAAGGLHFKNAFVTTALCSPSRASILTGRYAHNHKVVDNNDRAPAGTVFFSQYLQKAGYQTAFAGKWHMGGDSDEPQPGFDFWLSFRGQGQYFSPNPSWRLNLNGTRIPQKGYITDELTDYALQWLEGRDRDRPFFLYVSHKAVHAPFQPAVRHRELYKNVRIDEPATQADTPENYAGKPMWVKNQRNSWHGVDYPYHSNLDLKEYYRQYCQTLAAVDDSVGRLMEWLRKNDLERDTVVMLMGDNGFLFGEHGLIDKRNAYEESMRVPFLAHCPALFEPGKKVEGMVANIDIAPSILELAALQAPEQMDGRSFVGLATGRADASEWRKSLLYEYYWEWNFPHTPTTFALRGEDYKLIQYHGIWDTDELYDLKNDPRETKNLIRDPDHQQTVADMRGQLHRLLRETGGMQIPLGRKGGDGSSLRNRNGSTAAEFPAHVFEKAGKAKSTAAKNAGAKKGAKIAK